MSDLKTLMAGYVDDGKRKEIEERIEEKGYDSLHDIERDPILMTLLGLNKRIHSANKFRKALFEAGYLTEVPVTNIVENIDLQGPNSVYLDERVVGDKVEEHRRLVIDSPEFADHIYSNYDSLMDVVGVRTSLAKLFGVAARGTDIRRALFKEGFLTELPIEKLLADFRVAKNYNLYFDSEVVGEEMVELYKERLLRSREFREWLYREYPTLEDVRTDNALGTYLGVGRNAIEIREALQKRGFYFEFTIDEVVARLDTNRKYKYFDDVFVGEDSEGYRQQIIDSEQFANWVCNNFASLMDIKQVRTSLSRILGVRPKVKDVKRALFEEGFLTEIPIDEVVARIRGRTGFHSYFDPEVVGNMVEVYKDVVIRSDDFREWLYKEYPTLVDVKIDRSLGTLLGVNKAGNSLRKALIERGFYPEFSVAEVIGSLGRPGGNPYLDPKVVGDRIDGFREEMLGSLEFKEWLYGKYSSLADTNYSGDLANLLGINGKLGAMRKALVERGFYTIRMI